MIDTFFTRDGDLGHETPRDLLAAIHDLTKGNTEHVKSYDDGGNPVSTHKCRQVCNGLPTHTVEHPSLLVQIEQAVTPSAGNDGGSKSSSPRERNMVDSTALYEYAKMTAAIRDWCRIVGATISRNPSTDLERWYVNFTRYTDRDDTWHLRELRRWARVIRNHLDPPERLEIMFSCPVCGPAMWTDYEGETQVNRLSLEYRLDQDEHPRDERIICRNPKCGEAWEGQGAMEELAAEIREKASV
jgi:hypothetical protein